MPYKGFVFTDKPETDMRIFIKEWPDHSVTLLTESGQVVWHFDNVEDAVSGCRDWQPPRTPKPSSLSNTTRRTVVDMVA
jgi:hypothetical protein